jgi:hypothetical protein
MDIGGRQSVTADTEDETLADHAHLDCEAHNTPTLKAPTRFMQMTYSRTLPKIFLTVMRRKQKIAARFQRAAPKIRMRKNIWQQDAWSASA